jgi:hypothetical protein
MKVQPTCNIKILPKPEIELQSTLQALRIESNFAKKKKRKKRIRGNTIVFCSPPPPSGGQIRELLVSPERI